MSVYGVAFGLVGSLLAAAVVVVAAVVGLAYLLDGRRQARCRAADQAPRIVARVRWENAERRTGLHTKQPGRQGETSPYGAVGGSDTAALPAGSPPRGHVATHRHDVSASRGANGSDRPESRALRTAA